MNRAQTLAPTVPDMEIAVLGACLIDAKAAKLAAEELQPLDFFDDGRRLVFCTVQRLVQTGTPVDRVTVKAAADAIPATLLLDLEEAVPTAANAATYVKQVRTCGRTRTIHNAAKRLAEHTQNGADPEPHLRVFFELVGLPGESTDSADALPALDAPVAVLRKSADQGAPISNRPQGTGRTNPRRSASRGSPWSRRDRGRGENRVDHFVDA